MAPNGAPARFGIMRAMPMQPTLFEPDPRQPAPGTAMPDSPPAELVPVTPMLASSEMTPASESTGITADGARVYVEVACSTTTRSSP